jgi:hypothetical protein
MNPNAKRERRNKRRREQQQREEQEQHNRRQQEQREQNERQQRREQEQQEQRERQQREQRQQRDREREAAEDNARREQQEREREAAEELARQRRAKEQARREEEQMKEEIKRFKRQRRAQMFWLFAAADEFLEETGPEIRDMLMLKVADFVAPYMPYIRHYANYYFSMLSYNFAVMLQYTRYYMQYFLFEHDWEQQLIRWLQAGIFAYQQCYHTANGFIEEGYHPVLVGFSVPVFLFLVVYGAFHLARMWCMVMTRGITMVMCFMIRSVLIPCLTCSRYRRGWCRVERIEFDLSPREVAAARAAAVAADPILYAKQHRKGAPAGLGLSLTPTGRQIDQFIGSAAVCSAVKVGAISGAGKDTPTQRAKARIRVNDLVVGVNGNALVPRGGLPLGSFDALQLVRQAVTRAEAEAVEDNMVELVEDEQAALIVPTVTAEALLEFYQKHDPSKTLEECRSFCNLKQADLQRALQAKYDELPTLVEGAELLQKSGHNVPGEWQRRKAGVVLPFPGSASDDGSDDGDDGFVLMEDALLRFYLVEDPAKAPNVKYILKNFAERGKELRARLLHKYGAERLLRGLLPPSSRHNLARRRLQRALVSPDMPDDGVHETDGQDDDSDVHAEGNACGNDGAIVVREGSCTRKRGVVVLDVYRGQPGQRKCCFCLFPLRWLQLVLDTTSGIGSGEVANRSTIPVSVTVSNSCSALCIAVSNSCSALASYAYIPCRL